MTDRFILTRVGSKQSYRHLSLREYADYWSTSSAVLNYMPRDLDESHLWVDSFNSVATHKKKLAYKHRKWEKNIACIRGGPFKILLKEVGDDYTD